jgi:outer membrane protein assembly factor BamB
MIVQDLVLIASDRGCGPEGGGYVYAFEWKTGKLRWKLKAGAPSTSFAQIDGSIVFGTREDEWFAATLDSGKVKWGFRESAPDRRCQIRTAPVTDGGSVYLVTHENTIFGLSASGRRLWFRRPPSGVTTSLFMYKDVLYFGTQSGYIYAINPATDSFTSQLQISGIPRGRFAWWSKGEVDNEYSFAMAKKDGQTQGMLLAFSDEFERLLWSRSSDGEWTSEQPHVWKDWVIAGNCKGDVVAYRADDGRQSWSDHVKGCIRSFGHDDSTLYIGVQEGTVYAYRPPKR